jgi:hypothetical protein
MKLLGNIRHARDAMRASGSDGRDGLIVTMGEVILETLKGVPADPNAKGGGW